MDGNLGFSRLVAGQTSIPPIVREFLGLKEGDQIVYVRWDRDIIIEKWDPEKKERKRRELEAHLERFFESREPSNDNSRRERRKQMKKQMF